MKKLVILVVALTLTTGIFALPKKEDVKEPVKINVAALKGPTGLSMVELIHNKTQFMGANVSYNITGTPELVTAGLLSGEYDIAALPTNLAAIIYNKKPDYKIVATTGDGTLYVVSSRDDISSWKDLAGKKVYNIARSSTPGFLFNNLLIENEIDPDNNIEIDFTYNHVELAPMLIAGKVDTGILPEPLVTQVLLKNPELKVVLDFQEEYLRTKNVQSTYPLSCIVVKSSLLETNPEVIEEFLNALERSIHFVKNEPFNAGELGEKIGLGVNGNIIQKSISRLNLNFVKGEEAKKSLNVYYRILFESDPKSVGGKVPKEDFYY